MGDHEDKAPAREPPASTVERPAAGMAPAGISPALLQHKIHRRALQRRRDRDADASRPHRDYLARQEARVDGAPPEVAAIVRTATGRYREWIVRSECDPAALAEPPALVYLRFESASERPASGGAGRGAAAATAVSGAAEAHSAHLDQRAIDGKLDEYQRLAERIRDEAARSPRAGGDVLLSESPNRREALVQIAGFLMAEAARRATEPGFLQSSPEAVLQSVLARAPELRDAFAGIGPFGPIGEFIRVGPPPPTLAELGLELFVALLPYVGNAVGAGEAIAGRDLSDHDLDVRDRILLAVGVLVPIASALREGRVEHVMQRLVALTGRSEVEIEQLFRVARRLSQADVALIERLGAKYSSGAMRTAIEDTQLVDLARRLGADLRGGGAGATIGTKRTSPITGDKLEPGTTEHARQRWLEHQARDPERHKPPSGEVDPDWLRGFESGQRGAPFGEGITREQALAQLAAPGSTFRAYQEVLVEGYRLATREELLAALPERLAGLNDATVLRELKRTFRPRLVERMFKDGSRELTDAESIDTMRAVTRALDEADQGRLAELWHARFHARGGGEALKGNVKLEGAGIRRRPDFLDGETMVEVKSTRKGLGAEDVAQIEDYLRAAKNPELATLSAEGATAPAKKVRIVFTETDGAKGSMKRLKDWFKDYPDELSVEVFLHGRSQRFSSLSQLEAALSGATP